MTQPDILAITSLAVAVACFLIIIIDILAGNRYVITGLLADRNVWLDGHFDILDF